MFSLFEQSQRAPAECKIEINNVVIEDMYAALVEVEVTTDRSQFSEATLVFETRRLEDGNWTIQDDDRFRPWSAIIITALFGDSEEEVMRGHIREVNAEYPAEKGTAKVIVTCQDHSLKLERLQRNEPWGHETPTTDGMIATQIAQRNQLGLLETPGEGQTVEDLTQNMTDYRFLLERATASGYELYFRGDTLYFGEMRLSSEVQPTILVYAGTSTNCIRFNIQDDGNRPESVSYEVAAATGSEPNPQTVTSNLELLGTRPLDSSQAGLEQFSWRPQRQGVSDETQMQALAQQMANEESMKIKVNGELDGSLYGHVLRVGERVGVDGVGERYSGTYYVDTATHRFDMSGYRTTFKLLRNAYGDNLAGSANLLAGVL